ncbi:VOC family protein [Neobacillus rhizophilus]|uniref:VOC family protein n=1 Tax=Neobacillus rhizophilus TaxID=2833579 RepID=A0A942YVD6_9BACI|nr:VOC family protein [Neobacillus rhizophilus]MBS4212880.1 VOC family protein [Neobacillus rhizophilus]MBU8918991.1 VOC family protein [Bacillus sp. FJAT-29953]
MIKTIQLGYADFNCTNLSRMADYYENVIGLTLVEEGDQGEKYLSSSLDHHNIVLRSSRESELSTLGFQIAETDSLENIQQFLAQAGIHSELKSDYQPGIRKLLELNDPDGYTIHLYHHIDMPAPGYKRDSISPFKLGHIALGSKKQQESVDFYREILGFLETDKIGNRAAFLTCNSDHHVLNISNFGHKIMHHIAFQLKDSSHHTLSADFLASKNIPLVWGPFRHTAGHNLASYHQDPELNLIELYTEMDQYIPELGYFEPRPYHSELPLRPREWPRNCKWYPKVERDIIDSVLQKVEFNNRLVSQIHD